jgi:hypothetical protein
LLLLAGKIFADFSSEVLIGTQFKNLLNFQMSENFARILRIFMGFLLIGLSPGNQCFHYLAIHSLNHDQLYKGTTLLFVTGPKTKNVAFLLS